MLTQFKKDCITYAKLLGDYQEISINDLADGYCKALDSKNDLDQSKYLGALVLRFWYTINKMYLQSKETKLGREDFADWLVEAINYACKYRAWQDPTKKVNAQQAINKCISTIRLQHYYEFNLQKSKANFNNTSLDAIVSDKGSDHVITLGDNLSDGEEEVSMSDLETVSMIQTYVDKNKIIEAIIMDTIAFNETEKHTKEITVEEDPEGNKIKHTEYSVEFWPYKTIQLLSSLPEGYEKYFSSKYRVATAKLSASVEAIRRANNQKLYKYLDGCLSTLKQAYS